MGIPPIQVVPAILIGQISGGLTGGISHHLFGNIRLNFKKPTEDAKVLYILASCGTVGGIIGVFGGLNFPIMVVKVYIGSMVLIIGLILLLKKNGSMSWKKIFGFGLLSAFNKGISGGGYGPLVTGGQLISGRAERNSVGSTTASEVIVCIVGFLIYLLLGKEIAWDLSIAAISGAVLAAPVAAYIVKRMALPKLKMAIAIVTILLGIFTLVRVFGVL